MAPGGLWNTGPVPGEGALGQSIPVLKGSKGGPCQPSQGSVLLLGSPFPRGSMRPGAEGTTVPRSRVKLPFWSLLGTQRHLHELVIPPDCFRDVWLCNSNCLERGRQKRTWASSQVAPGTAGVALGACSATRAAQTVTRPKIHRETALKDLLT